MLILNERHEYSLNGERLPGVTSVINHFFPQWQAGDWYLKRGEMLHRALHLLAENDLDFDSLSPEISGRVRACERYKRETGCRTIETEVGLSHPVFRFAGTLDAIEEAGKAYWLTDWKSSLAPQSGPQVGAYSILVRHNRPRIKLAGARVVWLRNDGTYRVKTYLPAELRIQESAFTAMLSMYTWSEQNGFNDTPPAEPANPYEDFEL